MAYWVLLPIIVLVAAAFALVLLGFATRQASILWIFAMVTLLVPMFLTLDMMGLGIVERFSLPLFGQKLWDSPMLAPVDLPDLRLRYDLFSLFFQIVFMSVALLVVLATKSYIQPHEPHQAEYYALIFLSLVGMMLVASATDLFVLYLSFELTSLSTFALVGFRKKDTKSTEAALKFFIFGALSSAIILFGISILYGVAGNVASPADFEVGLTSFSVLGPLMARGVADFEPPIVIGIVFLIAGFGFKVATVPFHMWAPDVYEGSPTTITAYLAAGSKKLGVVALFKVFLTVLLAVAVDWIVAVAVLAVITQTIGNILAIPQRSVKRMLAYSSIAQAGYIIIALVVGTVAYGAASGSVEYDIATYSLAGGMYHVLTHAIMKSGAFLVVAATAVLAVGENIEDFRGLGRRMPFMALALTVFLLSLAGIPPFGGFFSKFVLFSSAVYASSINEWFLTLAIAGVLNSALSLYYYARVIRAMYMQDPVSADKIEVPAPFTVAVGLAFLAIIATGIFAQPFIAYLQEAARIFFS